MSVQILPIAKSLIPNQRAEIRLMDNLMRRANNAYPRISPYRIFTRTSNTSNEQPRYTLWLYNKLEQINDERERWQGLPLINFFSYMTTFVKYKKIGDCGESSSIMMSSLLANGYKDGRIARLVFDAVIKDLKSGKIKEQKIIDTTHEFVVRNLAENADPTRTKTYGKNLIIIDAWEGFCGNLQEGFKRFYDSFMEGARYFVNEKTGTKIILKPRLYFCPKQTVTDADVAIFRSNFPELVMK